MTTPPPPLSPTVATPLAHRKRRHSQINGSQASSGAVAKPKRHEGAALSYSPSGPKIEPKVEQSATNGSPSVKKEKTNNPPTIKQESLKAEEFVAKEELEEAERRIENNYEFESDGEIDKSEVEDIIDTAELEPYSCALDDDHDDEEDMPVLDPQTVSELRSSLLENGPEDFIRDNLESGKYSPSLLGTAFGLDPHQLEELGRELFLRVLQQLIVRAYFKRRKLPQYNTLDDVASLLKTSNKIVVIAGAGISTSLGIPDFRSKHTGFYDKVRELESELRLGISQPEDVFDIEIFDDNPEVFYRLAGGILPDEKRFSPTHAFIKLLQDKGKLLTCYTQNIDNLEQTAGIKPDKLIQCHGSFGMATCRKNGVKNPAHTVPGTDIFPDIRAGRVANCKACDHEMKKVAEAKRIKARFTLTPSRKRTPIPSDLSNDSDLDDNIPQPGVMKPDITFFGEQLPSTFFDRFTDEDCKVVDLVLVLGTSLKVAPVSEMPNYLPHKVPHVYVSREAIGHVNFDVQCLGDCDDVVEELCRRAGWWDGIRGHEMLRAKQGRAIIVEKEGEAPERWVVKREE